MRTESRAERTHRVRIKPYRVWPYGPRVWCGHKIYRPILYMYILKISRARMTHPKRERSLSRSVSNNSHPRAGVTDECGCGGTTAVT